MGKTNKCNLREDETSAEVVKKYPLPPFKYSANPWLSRFSFKPSFPNSS